MEDRHCRWMILLLFVIIGCNDQVNELTHKIKKQPYWCLSEVVVEGKQVPIKFATGFTLYGERKLSGHFPVNSFGGNMEAAADGTVTFGEVSWTEMGGGQAEIAEEMKLQKWLFKVDQAKFAGDSLVMSNEQARIKLKYDPCEFAYMETLQAKTWKFKGLEKKANTGVVVSYADPKKQYENLKKLDKLAATLKCKGNPTYDKKTSSLLYDISGRLGVNTYTGKLKISKNSGKMHIADIITTNEKGEEETLAQEQILVGHLEQLTNFSYMHDNLHIDTQDGTELIFQP